MTAEKAFTEYFRTMYIRNLPMRSTDSLLREHHNVSKHRDHKKMIMLRHAEGTPWYTRSKREYEACIKNLALIDNELGKRTLGRYERKQLELD
jgi:hypothetical protein